MMTTLLSVIGISLFTVSSADLDRLIPEGASVAYQIDARIVSCDCSMMCDTHYEDPVIFTRKDGKFMVVNPYSEPEDLGRPVTYEGQFEGNRFVGQREDIYTVNYLGRLHINNTFTTEILEGGESIRGKLKIKTFAEPADESGRAITEEFSKLYTVPCSVEAEFTGKRVADIPIDIDKRVAIWNLLKTHIDRVMMRDPQGSLESLEAGLAIEGDHHPAFLWRKSRAFYLSGEHLPMDASEERLKLFEAGIEAARKALLIDPEKGEASFFLSANLGRHNTTIGKLKMAFGLEEFEGGCLKAINDKAANNMFGFTVLGDAHFALGQFYRLVPDSWFVELLLGTRGDIKKSIEHLREAHKLQPTRGDYLKELGVALVCYGVEDEDEAALAEGKNWLEKAASAKVYAYPPELDYDQIKRLLANPDDACQFSRDQY